MKNASGILHENLLLKTCFQRCNFAVALARLGTAVVNLLDLDPKESVVSLSTHTSSNQKESLEGESRQWRVARKLSDENLFSIAKFRGRGTRLGTAGLDLLEL